MRKEDIKQKFSTINKANYPELETYSLSDIYEDKMGPGGLYLATHMTRKMDLKPGMKVMDLGCGMGTTSVFLAKYYNVQVFAIDLWIKAEQLQKKFILKNIDDKTIPLNLDITKELPFAEDYFDAIFCMDSFHYFGANFYFLKHLSRHLKPDGIICIGNPCFDRELSGEKLPDAYKRFWNDEFSKYHSTSWWRNYFELSGLFYDIQAEEIKEGQLLWEDELLFNLENNVNPESIESDADEIFFGRENAEFPYLTHYILSATKK